MEKLDCAVIGAGVVGLAIARKLAMEGREVILLEAADAIGTHTSSRNSEVIHAGIYYPTNSLKATLCVAGNRALYRYCDSRGVPYKKLGKLIVAVTQAQIETLKQYREQATANGAIALEWLSMEELRELEPDVECVAGLFSPSTGIIDSHALMLAYLADAEAHGATLALLSPVIAGRVANDKIILNIGGEEAISLICNTVINAAGLYAQQVANSIQGIPKESIPQQYLAKGHYFTLLGKSPFRHLVYPIAGGGGLGVHVTLDMMGQTRFGPDVTWIDNVDYSFDLGRISDFYTAIRRYYPKLQDGMLQQAYTGIRPKISPKAAPAADFLIQGPQQHGIKNLVNLYGIESPGLTASLPIADKVYTMLEQKRALAIEY